MDPNEQPHVLSASHSKRLVVLGARLAQARKEVGLNQQEAGDKIGVPSNTISRWETGQNDPGFTQMEKAAEVYGTALEWISGKTEDKGGLKPGYTIVDVRRMQTLHETLRTGGSLKDLTHLMDKPTIRVAYDIPEVARLVPPWETRELHLNTNEVIAELTKRSRSS